MPAGKLAMKGSRTEADERLLVQAAQKDPQRFSEEAGPEPATEAEFERAHYCARLFEWAEKLPSDQRRVIEMRFAEGRTIREIGAELKKTDGAVKQLQFRALQTLRAQMGEKKPGGRHG